MGQSCSCHSGDVSRNWHIRSSWNCELTSLLPSLADHHEGSTLCVTRRAIQRPVTPVAGADAHRHPAVGNSERVRPADDPGQVHPLDAVRARGKEVAPHLSVQLDGIHPFMYHTRCAAVGTACCTLAAVGSRARTTSASSSEISKQNRRFISTFL
mgnify:CR=1 FL=1